jgi:hypothetical protein
MRILAGIFGILCGAVIIAIVSRYGYQSADNALDGAIWGFTFGMIALGGLGAHAVAVRVWRESRVAALLIGLVGAGALGINLSNSLGALAGRSDERQAGRLQTAERVKNARLELKRAQSEREAMSFTPADTVTVESARIAFAAAENARKAECDLRGNRCRDGEADEKRAAATLADVSAAKAATDGAAALDADISRLSQQILAAGPILDANPQGRALARLLNLPDEWADWLTTWQGFGMAVVAELLIVLSLVAFELLRKKASPVLRVAEPVTIDTEAVEVLRQAPPDRPRLIASSSSPIGNVMVIMSEVMEPDGNRIEFEEAYIAYKQACTAKGRRHVSPEAFSREIQRICRQMKIGVERHGDLVFLNGVRLKKLSDVC